MEGNKQYIFRLLRCTDSPLWNGSPEGRRYTGKNSGEVKNKQKTSLKFNIKKNKKILSRDRMAPGRGYYKGNSYGDTRFD